MPASKVRAAGGISPSRSQGNKLSIGWREWIALPQLDIQRIKAKVDTGARTSALHAFNLETFRSNQRPWVRFEAHPLQRNDREIVRCELPVHDHRVVTNSGGHREKRFVVVTPIRVGTEEWLIEITLTDRDQLGFRMLLGRTAIKGRYVVDPARSFCRKRPAPHTAATRKRE